MKQDDVYFIIMTGLILLAVLKGIAIRHDEKSILQFVVEKFDQIMDSIQGIEPTNNYYGSQTNTMTEAKKPNCQVYAENRGSYCLIDCAGPNEARIGARYCLI